ncbi:MAG TPA: hypothetical protein VGM02_14675 [Acidobacteriaceae bacterium]|jgi:hypothetical protein
MGESHGGSRLHGRIGLHGGLRICLPLRSRSSAAGVQRGTSAYSDLVVMGGGVLGILWERENDDGLVFETRPIADLF